MTDEACNVIQGAPACLWIRILTQLGMQLIDKAPDNIFVKALCRLIRGSPHGEHGNFMDFSIVKDKEAVAQAQRASQHSRRGLAPRQTRVRKHFGRVGLEPKA